jgi:hypothetical protein
MCVKKCVVRRSAGQFGVPCGTVGGEGVLH